MSDQEDRKNLLEAEEIVVNGLQLGKLGAFVNDLVTRDSKEIGPWWVGSTVLIGGRWYTVRLKVWRAEHKIADSFDE